MRVTLTVFPSGALAGKITLSATTPEQRQEIVEFKKACGISGSGNKIVVIYHRKQGTDGHRHVPRARA